MIATPALAGKPIGNFRTYDYGTDHFEGHETLGGNASESRTEET